MNSVDASKGRIKSLDILRGGAIIGVIMVHIVFGAGREVDGGIGGGFNIAELAFAGLAMFMVITGYLHKKGNGFINNVKHRVVPIVITLIASTVILTSLMYGYMWILGYDLGQYDLFDDVMEIIVGKGCFQEIGSPGYNTGHVLAPYDISAGFYYLQILAVGLLIFYAIADSVLDDWRHCIIAILALVCLTALYLSTINLQLPFSAQLGPIVAAFLLIGALLRKYDVAVFIENGYREAKYWIILVSMAVVGALFIYFFPSGMTIYNTRFGFNGPLSVFTYVILSMSCGTVLWYIAALVAKVPLVSYVFTVAGMNSMILYTQHVFVAKLLTAPFFTLGTEFWIPIDSMAIRFAVLFITLGIIFTEIHMLRGADNSLSEEDIVPNPTRYE